MSVAAVSVPAERRPILCAHADANGDGAHWLRHGERCSDVANGAGRLTPGARPGAVEGSDPGTVVGVQAGDHAAPGGEFGDLTPYELTGAQCVLLATLLREAADAISPRPCTLTNELERWANTLTLAEVVE